MPKCRVLHVIDSVAHDAGTEKQLEEWIRRIDHDRFETHLCCFEDSERLRRIAEHEWAETLVLPLVRVYTPNGIRQMFRLRRYINEQQIDIVQTFFIKANIVGVLAARKSRCKAIVACRLNLGYYHTPMHRRILRYLDKHTARLLANGEAVKQTVIDTEHVPAEMIDIIYNRVDTAAYAPGTGDASVANRLGIPRDAKVVGIVANLRPVKDHALFLRAARIVAGQVPDAVFVLVGQGELEKPLQVMASELGIADKVFFAGRISHVQDYLERMDIGCLSSSSEGFPNTILEYMAAGLPVVATDVGSNREAIEHGVTGYVVPHGRPDDFARPIIELLRDNDKLAQMGRKALQHCRAKFDIEITIREFEEYYARLAGGKI